MANWAFCIFWQCGLTFRGQEGQGGGKEVKEHGKKGGNGREVGGIEENGEVRRKAGHMTLTVVSAGKRVA